MFGLFYVVYNSHIALILSANDQNKLISFSEHTLYDRHGRTHTHASELFKQSEHQHAVDFNIYYIGHCFRLPLIVCSCDCDGIINFACSHIVIVGCMFIAIVYVRYKKENI